MKKQIITAILLLSLVSCSTDDSSSNCHKITNISFNQGIGYQIHLENGNTINTGYVLPNYETGDTYCY